MPGELRAGSRGRFIRASELNLFCSAVRQGKPRARGECRWRRPPRGDAEASTGDGNLPGALARLNCAVLKPREHAETPDVPRRRYNGALLCGTWARPCRRSGLPGGREGCARGEWIQQRAARPCGGGRRGQGRGSRHATLPRPQQPCPCTDVAPPVPAGSPTWTCSQQKLWGKCNTQWMIDSHFCEIT